MTLQTYAYILFVVPSHVKLEFNYFFLLFVESFPLSNLTQNKLRLITCQKVREKLPYHEMKRKCKSEREDKWQSSCLVLVLIVQLWLRLRRKTKRFYRFSSNTQHQQKTTNKPKRGAINNRAVNKRVEMKVMLRPVRVRTENNMLFIQQKLYTTPGWEREKER